ncbi:hypothetical protein SODALDRAFT_378077 [Sodiomyces alkalinus F11]|uniref:Uncharacterized protein n=1 Tax=Sodiomyces alkalinus (strain CBS 110278 / VKM F-3762 / F11) TaxID=1314773 RepID=A0A3N2PWT7_SODAK|nr:hypothetical protein SODALDRAFT_378077 [Sodiomyces alkalinus F11]ROT38942.1 hypothetical protein SODALDRAFT_378077 [Sodiomyces alkalinus F11]
MEAAGVKEDVERRARRSDTTQYRDSQLEPLMEARISPGRHIWAHVDPTPSVSSTPFTADESKPSSNTTSAPARLTDAVQWPGLSSARGGPDGPQTFLSSFRSTQSNKTSHVPLDALGRMKKTTTDGSSTPVSYSRSWHR